MTRDRRLSRRRLLLAALGITAGVAAGCTGQPPSKEPSPSPDASLLHDDISDGVTVQDRGFSTFAVAGGEAGRRIVGAAAVLRNTTGKPMRAHVRLRLVDGSGHGWRSAEQNDWTSVINTGWVNLPPGQSVDFGGAYQVDASQAARVAGVVLYVRGETVDQSVLLPATIGKLTPPTTPKDEWSYVTFGVDNTGAGFKEPNYSLVFRSPEGRLIGGWFVDRATSLTITPALPEGETDEYPRGASEHTLPTWLPPGIQPKNTTMYVWP
ncbi:hypothetical protein [Actinoplanes palleronii]|uniref:Lipoprotein n=1 Tax=Actinoplanes palleronii TaxID=113570 RepID=A0ABQ4BDE9_9ACTN|nr:hypothetical protein [Actinoplanes palleronii]GIE68708.1 hypothetical protein Apa02nite_048160 [Actinoplanes palleronii]